MGLFLNLLIGALAGWIAGRVMVGTDGTITRNIILGLCGGVIGSIVLGLLGIHGSGVIGTLIVSVVGACILIWLARKFF
ncbi:MAG: GlsB/YeaQ/YmgE family stress response membrane protein [Lachnospiraceae bacterium]|nr:GlsB/YeaQ/YmgE family stress response membrane protein [Lachnospiraceae bacterium]